MAWRGLAAGVVFAMSVLALGLRYNAQLEAERASARQRDAQARQAEQLNKRLSYVSGIQQADRASREGAFLHSRERLTQLQLSNDKDNPPGFEWFYLERKLHTERRTLLGHKGDVYHVEYSPDGTMLASSGQDGTVRLWDATSGAPIRTIQAHDNETNWVTFSPDGTTLATTGDDGTIRLWSVKSGERVQVFSRHEKAATIALFTPNGRQIISCSHHDGLIKVWDIQSGNEVSCFGKEEKSPGVDSMALSPQGPFLATVGGADVNLRIWDITRQTTSHTIQATVASGIETVAFSPDGALIAAAGYDRAIRVWSYPDLVLRHTLRGHEDVVSGVAFSHDGKQLFSTSSDSTLRTWNLETEEMTAVLPGHQNKIWGLACSPKTGTIATASKDQTVMLWDLSPDTNWERIATSEPVQLIRFSSEAEVVLVSISNGVTSFWSRDPVSGKFNPTRQIELGKGLTSAVVNDNGSTLATIRNGEQLEVWDLAHGTHQSLYRPTDGRLLSNQLAIDRSGRVIGTESDRGFVVWRRFASTTKPASEPESEVKDRTSYIRYDLPFTDLQHALGGPAKDGNSVQRWRVADFTADGGVLLVPPLTQNEQAGKSVVWRFDADAPHPVLEYDGVGNEFAEAVRSWQKLSGHRYYKYSTENGHDYVLEIRDAHSFIQLFLPGLVSGVDCSPDGRVLAISDSLRRVRLWDILTGRDILSIDGLEQLRFEGLEQPGVQLTFSADGKNLAANLQRAGEVYISGANGVQITEAPAKTGPEAR